MRLSHLFIVLWITLSSAFAAQKPRLVIVIAVDQLRSDYLTRFEGQFLPAAQKGGKPGGFRYLMDKGAYFTNAQTAHAYNVTGVGHATILTGALPYLHGIVANRWYDFDLKKNHYCVYDPKTELVGALKPEKDAGRSPRTLLTTTVGDELKNALGGKPIVASVAVKDRAAILMGGHRADLAVWFSEPIKYHGAGSERGEWVTSTYYAPDKQLPMWLTRWNTYDYRMMRAPKLWKKLLPESAYWMSTEAPQEAMGDGRGLGRAFPHPIENAGALMTSPWGNDYVLDTAVELIKNMKLGADEVPDLLTVGLSSFDALGHNYGPMSAEMQDATIRLDRSLAGFFAQLSKLVPGGLSNVLLVLTADHGVQASPVLAQKLNLPGEPYWDDDMGKSLNDELKKKLDVENLIVKFTEGQMWLDREAVKKSGKSASELARQIAAHLREKPMIAAAYAREDLLTGHVPPTLVARKMASSVHPTRSGDVVYVARPGYVALEPGSPAGTGHESGTVQDAAIPIVFAGAGIHPGRHADDASMLDIAPTLAQLLGIVAPSGSEGHPLVKALRSQ